MSFDHEEARDNEPYVQCLLFRHNSSQMTYIPEKFAKKNHWIKIKNEQGEWENGWLVKETFQTMPGWKLDALRNVRINLGRIEEGL